MRYIKQIFIIFGVTLIGELLNDLLPLPVPAGVYGLFLLLVLLCTKAVRLEQLEQTGHFLLDIMPVMFVPITAGLLETYQEISSIVIPMIAIAAVSTIIVMVVTGRTAQWMIKKKENRL